MSESSLSYKHILVAIDLSENSDHILKRAHSIATASNAKISVVHVMAHAPMAYGGELSIPIDAELEAALTKEAKIRLAKLADTYSIPDDGRYLKEGSVKTALISLSEALKIDLIVIGSHGHNGLSALIGSQANAILNAAKCDVWMIHI